VFTADSLPKSNDYLDAIAKAMAAKSEGSDYDFNDRDVILYSTDSFLALVASYASNYYKISELVRSVLNYLLCMKMTTTFNLYQVLG